MLTLQHGLEGSTTTEWQEWVMTLLTWKYKTPGPVSGTISSTWEFQENVTLSHKKLNSQLQWISSREAMINSDGIREMLMQDYQLQSLSEPSAATQSLQRHPHYNSTWVPEDYSTINNKQYCPKRRCSQIEPRLKIEIEDDGFLLHNIFNLKFKF